MRSALLGSGLGAIALALGPAEVRAADQTFATTVTWTQNNDGIESGPMKGACHLWIPDGVPVVRGAIVEVGDVQNDPAARAVARRHGFALLGCSFSADAGGSVTNFSRAYGGSGQALLDALAQLAAASGRPEIAHLPLALFGYSIAGQFAYEFAMWKPDRVLCFMLNKGGFYFTVNNTVEAGRQVPGWLVAGSTDTQSRMDAITNVHAANRPLAARWAFTVEWGAGHVEGATGALFFPLFDRVVRHRYPAGASPLAGPVALGGAPPEELGWLGDLGSWRSGVSAIAPHEAYAGDRDASAWLFDADLAALWRAFTSSAADGSTPVSLVASPAGPVLAAGSNVTLTANVTGFPGVTSVSFYRGAEWIGSDGSSPYSMVWAAVPGGVNPVSAVAVDGLGTERVSRPLWFVAEGEIPGTPAPPTRLSAVASGDAAVDLAWSDNADNETGYSIERSVMGTAFEPIAAVGPDATGYTDAAALADARYRVRALPGAIRSNEAGTGWGLARWRNEWFGSAADAGSGADDADPDRDGVRNRLEFALGTRPLDPGPMPFPNPAFIDRSGEDHLALTTVRDLDAAGVKLMVEASGNLTAWQPAVPVAPAIEGWTDRRDFDAGAVADWFALLQQSGTNPYSVSASGGIGGTPAIDLGSGTSNDATLVLADRPIDLAGLAYLEVDLFFRKKATTSGITALQIALVGAPTTRINGYDDPGTTEDAYASVRLGRNGTALRWETQTKPGTSATATTANAGPNLALADGAWYQVRVCFARVDAERLRVWATLHTGYASGAATNVLGGLGPVTLDLSDIAADGSVHVALRGFGDAGSDLWDRLEVRGRDRRESLLWHDPVAAGSANARFLRVRAVPEP